MSSFTTLLCPERDAPPRLLVVDDDAGTIQVLARVLASIGEVFFALNGREGLDAAWRVRPEIILLDAEMPEMNGFQVCAKLKEAPELADIPVLFLTAHREIEHEIQALALGAVDFIHKPISPPIVHARMCTHLALKRRTDELQRLARLDGLTGIANRRSFDLALAAEWRRVSRTQTPLSLLLADVDFFKRYNDLYGHVAGDECLKAVAAAFVGLAKRSSDLAARYGGEEFVLLLPYTAQEQAAVIAEQLCECVRQLALPHAASDVADKVTISVGITTLAPSCPSNGDPAACLLFAEYHDALPEVLVEAADQALYQAKHQGRNRVVGTTLHIQPPPSFDS